MFFLFKESTMAAFDALYAGIPAERRLSTKQAKNTPTNTGYDIKA